MDKWLWAARFFKTRAFASRACELGRIESNGQQAKASREVRVGDKLQIKKDSGVFQI
jgi:ribosome-associated heat shock protein Hsp15